MATLLIDDFPACRSATGGLHLDFHGLTETAGGCYRCLNNDHAETKSAAMSGPMTKSLRPKREMP